MAQTILLVEDAPSSRKMLSFTLTKAGYEVVEAEDGRDALKKLQDLRVDLFITDVHMPQMDGLSFVRELRKNSRYRNTPVILLTSDSTDPVKDEGKALGIFAWIGKPYKAERLLELVKKVLQQGSGK